MNTGDPIVFVVDDDSSMREALADFNNFRWALS